MEEVPGFCILGRLGRGASGQVFVARDKITGETVAIKRLLDHGCQEEIILSSCHHDNIIELKEVIVQSGECPSLVMEYMEGSLFDFSRSSFLNPMRNPNDVKGIMRQIMMGLEYLHANKILHLDIKPQNILVNVNKETTTNGNYKVKLADFGLSARFGVGNRLPKPNSVMTLGYVPPELLLGMRDYGPTVDVWSAGCVFLGLLLGKGRSTPLSPQGDSEVLAFRKIVELFGRPSEANWPGVSRLPGYQEMVAESMVLTQHQSLRDVLKGLGDPTALDLLERMLTLDPAQRITAQEALESEYLKVAYWQPVEFDSEQFSFSPKEKRKKWPVEFKSEQFSFRPKCVKRKSEDAGWEPVEFSFRPKFVKRKSEDAGWEPVEFNFTRPKCVKRKREDAGWEPVEFSFTPKCLKRKREDAYVRFSFRGVNAPNAIQCV